MIPVPRNHQRSMTLVYSQDQIHDRNPEFFRSVTSMDVQKTQEIENWQRAAEDLIEEDDRVKGEVKAFQQISHDEVQVDNSVVVIRRGDPPEGLSKGSNGNIVSLRCIDRFPDGSWDKIGVQKPKHGERVKLWLKHKDFGGRQRLFEFEVDEFERHDIVLGKSSIDIVDGIWRDAKGRICVIRGTKKKISLDQDLSNAALTNTKHIQRQLDKEEEKQRRKAHRQAISNASADSTNSPGSSGSTASSAFAS